MKNTYSKINKYFSSFFKSQNLIIFLGCLTVVPFIIISYYNNPSADDFNYNYKSHNLGYWKAQLFWYKTWSGRYFSTAILSIKTLVANHFTLYKAIPIILLSSLFSSFYYLSSIVFYKLKKELFFITSFLFIILYLMQMPNIAEGLYWLAGSITYQVANIFTILFLCFILKLLYTHKPIYLVLSSICAIIVIGSNETSMLIINYLLFTVLIYKFYQKKTHYSFIILFVIGLLFSIAVIESPGNEIRSLQFQNNKDLIYSVIKSTKAVQSYIGIWLPFSIILTFIFFNYLDKKVTEFESILFTINPKLILIVSFGGIFIGFFTAYWSVGRIPPERTINVIYFFFILAYLYLTLSIFFRLKSYKKPFIKFSSWARTFIIIILFINLSHKNNIKTAYIELFNGTAKRYNEELKNRYKTIKHCNSDTCYVPQLKYKPTTIYAYDITKEHSNWKNLSYKDYFGKESIIIKEPKK